MQKKIICILLLICFLVIGINAKEKINKETLIPKNLIVIAQSCTMSSVVLTVVDLDNNELVIITYYVGLDELSINDVKRTGCFINLDTQLKLQGSDAPFQNKRR